MEKATIEIPQELDFRNLRPYINSKYKNKVEKVWRLLQKNQQNFKETSGALINWWLTAPTHHNDQEAVKKVTTSPIPLRQPLRNSAIALISESSEFSPILEREFAVGEENSDPLSGTPLPIASMPLPFWKRTEDALRLAFYTNHKEFMVSLRTYYEVLLRSKKVDDDAEGEGIREVSKKGNTDETEKREFIIPPEVCPSFLVQKLKGEEVVSLRDYISLQNRWATNIDGLTQILAVAKTQHNGQEKNRLRKTQNIPFAYHPFEVTLATFRDVIPYVIEEEKLGSDYNMPLLLTVCALHDILEDTELTIADIREKVKGVLDAYDSSLTPLLNKLGEDFGLSARDIINKYLDMLSEKDLKDMRKILKIISNNSTLDEDETRAALRDPIAGTEKTKKLLGLPQEKGQPIDNQKLSSWHLGAPQPPQSQTFSEYEQEYDGGKLAKFLIKLQSGKGKKHIKQFALIVKNEDRAHNIQKLEGMPMANQLATLRATTTRLIAWQMLDHDYERPVFNTLPRLIQTTIWAYERLEQTAPRNEDPDSTAADKWSSSDNEFLSQLYEWQEEIGIRNITMEVPKKVEEITSNWQHYNSTRKPAY